MPDEPRVIVVDASVVLKWQLYDEECISQARALKHDIYVRGVLKVIAPQLMAYEVVNGLVTAVRRKRLTPDQARESISNLVVLDIELRQVQPAGLLDKAIKFNLTAYDAAYLALAEEEKCDLWTGDKAFYIAMRSTSSYVKWIGDYAA